MRIIILLFVTVFSATGANVRADDNPFIRMATEAYADYCRELEQTAYINREMRDTLWMKQVAGQMREADKVSKNKKWALEADFFEQLYLFAQFYRLHKSDSALFEERTMIHISNLQQVIRQAQKIKVFDIELRALNKVWMCYRYDIKNYEMAFRYCQEIDRALSAVSTAQYPFKPLHYRETGQLYLEFKEYGTAKLFFEKGLADAENVYDLLAIWGLWNNLGLLYLNQYGDIEKSDSCFREIINTVPLNPQDQSPSSDLRTMHTKQDDYEMWAAIAKGNLGSNRYRSGDFDEAIPLLLSATRKVAENHPENSLYGAAKMLTLSELYISKSNLAHAGLYLEKTYDYLEKDRVWDNSTEINPNLAMHYYRVMSRYYRLSGNAEQSLLYADSAAYASMRNDNSYNLRQLLRAEQHNKQQELDAEMLRSKIYFRNMMLISACAMLFLIFMLVIYFLYRQKQSAYRALVIKTRQWAEAPFVLIKKERNITKAEKNSIDEAEPNETDLQIFDKLNQLIVEKPIHLNSEISIDQTAKMLGVNRAYLSQAVNRCTGDSFTVFINEYRVKEAVRLMSDDAKSHVAIEDIAYNCGFNARTFYRVFKKTTGFSPATFRNKALSMKS